MLICNYINPNASSWKMRKFRVWDGFPSEVLVGHAVCETDIHRSLHLQDE